MSDHIGLYYPTIEFNNDSWIKLAALYWDKMGRIVPADYKPSDSVTVRKLKEELGFIIDLEPSDLDKRNVEFLFLEMIYNHRDELVEHYNVNLGPKPRHMYGPSILSRKKVKRKLRQELVRNNLAKLLEINDTSDLVMHPKLAFIYLEILAEQMASARQLFPVTDNLRDHIAISGYPLDRLTQALLNSDDNKPHLVEASLRTHEIEVEMATIALQSILPKDIENVPTEKIIKLRNKHRDELTAFQNYIHELTDGLENLQNINDPMAFKAHLELEYRKKLKPQLDDLKKCMKSLGVDTVMGVMNIRVALPPLLTLAGTFLAREHLDPIAPIVVGSGAIAFSLFPMIRRRQNEAITTVRSSPSAYLLYIEEDLEPTSIVSNFTHYARQMLFQV